MARRTTRKTLAAAAVLCIIATVLSGVAWHYLAQRRSLPFALTGEPVVGRRISSHFASTLTPPPDDAPRLRDWPVIGEPAAVAPDVAAELREILGSPSTYTFFDSDCFEPGMAVSFGEGAYRVDVLICLLCDRAVFYRGDRQVGRHISDQGKMRLTAIYQRLFGTPVPQL